MLTEKNIATAKEIITILSRETLTRDNVSEILDAVKFAIDEQAVLSIPEDTKVRCSCGSYATNHFPDLKS